MLTIHCVMSEADVGRHVGRLQRVCVVCCRLPCQSTSPSSVLDTRLSCTFTVLRRKSQLRHSYVWSTKRERSQLNVRALSSRIRWLLYDWRYQLAPCVWRRSKSSRRWDASHSGMRVSVAIRCHTVYTYLSVFSGVFCKMTCWCCAGKTIAIGKVLKIVAQAQLDCGSHILRLATAGNTRCPGPRVSVTGDKQMYSSTRHTCQ